MTRRRTTPRRPPRPRRPAESAALRARRAARVFARLVRVMDMLRSPAGCPWDRKQTPRSLRPFLLEETYEAVEAIDRRDADTLCGELGDVLFQCVFQAQIAAETRRFEIADSIRHIVDKLIRRHPHVFDAGGKPLRPAARKARGMRSPTKVLEQWETLKAREQRAAGKRERVLAGVPRAMPALLRAHEIGTRVAAVGFDWPAAADVLDKVDEEVRELREALTESPARASEELGDVLFAIANLSRKLGLEAESALREANNKFTARFAALEALLERRGRTVHAASLAEMESAWNEIKRAPSQQSSTAARSPSRSAPRRRRSRG